MLARTIARLVDISTRAAVAVVVICVLGGIMLGDYAVTHLSVDTDTNDLISPDLPWRKREAEFDRAFPQNVDLLAIVIDAGTPGQAEDAAATLARWLRDRPALYRTVRRPDGGEFFTRDGLLFLSTKEVQDVADQLITAQPLLGALAADPSLRGLFSAISLALEGVKNGEITLAALAAPLTALADPIEAALAGRPHHLSWESLFTGRTPQPQEMRRFILVQPTLDYSALEPGARASSAIRVAAKEFGLTPEHGVR
ncbi:MAG: MMPL family transporter, partial [Bradyrhizobium sp.]